MRMPDNQARFMGKVRREVQNDYMKAQNTLLAKAIESLQREGHTIHAWGSGPGRPFVWLAASPMLISLARLGKGVYYMRGVDARGQHYRRGQLLDYRNVLVIWEEKGH